MMNLADKKVGIVLSGGGAKGAYQIGMLRALEEAGLNKKNLYLAGSSIGALVSMIYACRDINMVRAMFYGFGDALKAAKEGAENAKGGSPEEMGEKAAAMTLEALKQLLPDDLLEGNKVPVTACSYCVNKKMPMYFCLNGLEPAIQRKLLIASASIPGIYPPVEYERNVLVDGGIVPPGLEDAEPADKMPARALKESPIDIEIINHLNLYDTVRREDIHPVARLLEIFPSSLLEEKPHAGTLDFSKEKMMAHEELGYRDTREILEKSGD